MPNREKVIKGLECCIQHDPDDKPRCRECPYEGACLNRLKNDALALLKRSFTPEEDSMELKPCPFCGRSKYVVIHRSGEPPYDYYVVCDASGHKDNPDRGCGGSAGAGDSIDEARELWNRRADQ